MVKLMLLIKVSRPVFWLLGPFVFLAGLYYGGSSLSVVSSLQMLALSFPLSLFAFGINDIYDYKSDKLNPRKNLLEGIVLKPRFHRFVLLFSALCSFFIFFLSLFTFNPENIFITMLVLLILFLYSAKPVRLKELPPLDSLSNGLITLLVFALGYSYSKNVLNLSPNSILIALCVAGGHAYTTIPDYVYDKKTKTRTFAVIFGKRTAAFSALVAFIIALSAAKFSPPIIAYMIICCIVFFITLLYPSEKLAKLLSRILFIAFFICSAAYIYMKIFK